MGLITIAVLTHWYGLYARTSTLYGSQPAKSTGCGSEIGSVTTAILVPSKVAQGHTSYFAPIHLSDYFGGREWCSRLSL